MKHTFITAVLLAAAMNASAQKFNSPTLSVNGVDVKTFSGISSGCYTVLDLAFCPTKISLSYK